MSEGLFFFASFWMHLLASLAFLFIAIRAKSFAWISGTVPAVGLMVYFYFALEGWGIAT